MSQPNHEMKASDQATLGTLSKLIVADAISPQKALETAYFLGKLEGQIGMAFVAEKQMQELARQAA